ncbi:Guanine nucleotide binding protein (G-protein), alpha subunit [Amanita muscaria]
MYEPKAFRAERASWRAVIQLNVVRSIHLILDAIDQAVVSSYSDRTSHHPSPDLLKLKLRLVPLLEIEKRLLHRLTPAGSGEVEATQLSYTERSRAFFKELAINAAVKWKDAFVRSNYDWDRESLNSEEAIDWDNPKDPGAVLYACSTDMIKLWNSTEARKILEIQNLRIEELAGFFLDSLERVTSLRYVPTDDDILRARLKTLGVKEHKFRISSGTSPWRDLRIFDVGGHRSQVRAAWAPYFDDMDAIIFLAPISCFDQVLSEDPSVNRLEDSVHLWKSVVSNKLLKNTNLILFLNKIDIMKMKLNAGIRMADYILSYGNRANDFERASGYLRRKFNTILKEYSPTPRMFYGHFTTVTDTKSTKIILFNLREMLLRQHLAQASLIQ